MTAYHYAVHALVPGSLALLLIALAICFTGLQFRSTAGWATGVLGLVIVGYWIMSVPLGAWWLGRLVSAGYSTPLEQSRLDSIDAIVVLDANTIRYGNGDIEIAVPSAPSALRAAEAIRLYRGSGPMPPLVIVSAGAYVSAGKHPEGDALRRALVDAGIPAGRVTLDSQSRNTREHAANVSAILRALGVQRIALVTSAVHMRRAMRAFAGIGLIVIPAPAPLPAPESADWWPRVTALKRSLEAWYEVFGLLRDQFDSHIPTD